MKLLKIISSIAYWLLILFLFSIAGLAFLSATQLSNKFRLFVVLSGSMEPTILTGSLVLVQPQVEYQKGDIVTFVREDEVNSSNPKNTITHRIAEVNEVNKTKLFTTKGDANDVADQEQVPPKLVLGKVTHWLPYLGRPVGFVKTQTGFVLLVIIPATIIVYSELMSMKKEAARLLSNRKKKAVSANQKEAHPPAKKDHETSTEKV